MAPRRRASAAALQASRDAFKTLDKDRERFQRVGLGPGESYVGLWRICSAARGRLGEVFRAYLVLPGSAFGLVRLRQL
jgi:hypothetical protein